MIRITMMITMNDEKNPPPHYHWPWFVLGMVILGIVLAIVWMTFAVRKVERERNFNAPAQTR
ncbi:MAG TPA: hypothetical protein VN625_10145 [Desulfuromonadaceae bacterium]|nr:hypothetical protein [Desulfuromonadaceae bacterium]